MRIATIILVLCSAAFVGVRGSRLFYFSAGRGEPSATFLQAFTRSAGLAYAAQDSLLSLETSSKTPASSLIKGVTDVLTVRPMSSGYWLSLARLDLSANGKSFLDAMTMSNLTGPNEGDIAAPRAILGLSIWNVSAADIKSQALSDLGIALSSLSQQQLSVVKKLVSEEPTQVQQTISLGLRTQGLSAKQIGRIGL